MIEDTSAIIAILKEQDDFGHTGVQSALEEF